MGRKKIPGLVNRQGTWHIDKVIRGRRVCESTGTSDLEEAERYLARRMEAIEAGRSVRSATEKDISTGSNKVS